VLWAGEKDGLPVSYPVKITLLCDDRFGMLKQITALISDTHTNIRNIEARSQNGQASVDVVLEIADLKHLQKIMDGVRQIPRGPRRAEIAEDIALRELLPLAGTGLARLAAVSAGKSRAT